MTYFWTVLFITVMVGFMIALAAVLLLWLRRQHHTREPFAFAALTAVVSLALALFAAAGSGSTPWALFLAALVLVITGKQFVLPQAGIVDYAFLGMVYIFALQVIWRLHRQWDGLKSIEQYHREQRSESSSPIIEGLYEFRRIAKRGPRPELYFAPDPKQYISQLEPVIDSFAWKDQARELLRLSSSAYIFDSNTGWHDKAGCWVGQNANTADLVFLYPVQEIVTGEKLNDFLRYAERISADYNREMGELIVACKKDTIEPVAIPYDRRIRFETEAALLNTLVDFKDYVNEIRKRVLIDRLPDSDLTLKDVYVPSRFHAPDSVSPSDNIEEYLLNWLSEPSQRQLALLGEYGQGKSTATLMFAYRLLCESYQSATRIPILIELRGMSPRNLTPLQLLGAWAAQYNINPQALMKLHIGGRLFLIFEGFDEMALVGDAEMRLRHFRVLWQFAYPHAKILITGRPNFFFDEEEMKAALGISKPVGDHPYCEAVRLAPFNALQINQALRTHEATVRDQIYTLVSKNPRFEELVSRPSLLHIVSVLWKQENLVEKVDKLNSAYVMDLFVRHSYRRQGLKEMDSPEFMALTTLEREYFMSGVATYMATNQLPNQITGLQLNKLISKLIEDIPDSISTVSSAISGEITKPLRLRIKDSEHGIEHVRTDVRACGLLVDDPAAPNMFRFGHKSFMEYLFAAVVAERLLSPDSEKARAVLYATEAGIIDIISLPVSIAFLSELIGTSNTTRERRNDKDTIQSTREYTIAKRLLVTIMGKNNRVMLLWKPVIFWDVSYRSLMRALERSYLRSKLRTTPKRLRSRLSFLSLITILVLMGAVFPIAFNELLATSSRPTSSNRSSFIGWFFWLMIPLFLVEFIMMATILSRRRLRLWNRICKELDIQDQVLHRLSGTWLIPWTRNQSFDYYLDEGNSGADGRNAPLKQSNTVSR